ncbi:Lrp/AsnC family transcriptional regulator [Parvularcula maris]|uniref:Lrp/AsnC family transcriptional regulator n=1 Tax=Parvularcula maris TaxID=2965077 RepID=A0A9X2L9P6_9PROT|nr:Lrp/AsnC family transcriptional regulator [Parvularcula maris]MCQ8185531.1 Lrp/AsnC family transcriptional regulator [Parvularcula maris]
MDDFDRRLLNELQRDNRQSYDRLAEAVNLSPTAVRRRVTAMRKRGVIAKDVSILAPAASGVTVIVSVRFEKESHATYRAFKDKMLALPEVTQCYAVSGEVDFILIAQMPDLAAWDRWIDEHLLSDDSLARSTTNIVTSEVKFETAVPV